jgi:hypothetical protein
MAATVNSSRTVLAVPFGMYEWKLSSLTSDALETLTYGDFTEQTPDWVEFVVTTQADDHSSIAMDWVSTTAASSQIAVRFKVEPGGNLAGAVVKVRAQFFAMGQGGISA